MLWASLVLSWLLPGVAWPIKFLFSIALLWAIGKCSAIEGDQNQLIDEILDEMARDEDNRRQAAEDRRRARDAQVTLLPYSGAARRVDPTIDSHG